MKKLILLITLFFVGHTAFAQNDSIQIENSIKNCISHLRVKLKNPNSSFDVSQYADTLNRYFYSESVNISIVFEMMGKLTLQSYYLVFDESKANYTDIERSLFLTRKISAFHDNYFYICAEGLGRHCEKTGDINKAIAAYQCCLMAISKSDNNTTQAIQHSMYLRLASLNLSAKRYIDAIGFQNKAVKTSESLYGKDSDLYLENLDMLGTVNNIAGRYEQADSCWTIIQDNLAAKNDTSSELYLKTIINRAEANNALSRYDIAEILYVEYLKMPNNSEEEYIYVLSEYASLLYSQEKYASLSHCLDNALNWLSNQTKFNIEHYNPYIPILNAPTIGTKYADKFIALITPHYNPNNLSHVAVLANIHSKAFHFNEAHTLYKAALNLADSHCISGDTHFIESAFGYLSNMLIEMSDIPNAIKYAEIDSNHILNLTGSQEHPLYIESMQHIANLYQLNGDYRKSNSILRKCNDISKEKDYTNFDIGFGLAYGEFQIGNFAQAIETAEQILPSTQSITNRWNTLFLIASSLASETDLNTDEEDNEQRNQLLQKLGLCVESLSEFCKQNYSEHHINNILYHITNASYHYLCNNQESMLDEAAIAEKLINQHVSNQSLKKTYLESLAMYHIKAKDYKKALSLVNSDIKHSSLDVEQFFTTMLLSDIYSGLGKTDKAQAYYCQQAERIIDMTKKHFSILSEKNRAAYWRMYNQQIYNAGKFATSSDSDFAKVLYDLALFSKGLLLNTSREFTQAIHKSGNERLISSFELMNQIKNTLKSTTLSADERRKLTQQADDIEMTLISECKEYGEAISKNNINWKQVKDSLPPRSIAIEFISYKNEKDSTCYGALMLRREWANPHFSEIGYLPFDEITSWEECDKLSASIWGILKVNLHDIDNIYFAATDKIHTFPIEYLPDFDNPALQVSDKWNIYRLSSTRELVIANEKTNITHALAYGDLAYDMSVDNLVNNSIKYSLQDNLHTTVSDIRGSVTRLPGTKCEIEQISATLKSQNIETSIFTDTIGTESSFKNQSGKQMNIMHFATHGFYSPESKIKSESLPSYLIGSTKHAEDYALLQSGLFLSGANIVLKGDSLPEHVDDGILSAKEISELNFPNLDLVVLSACQTGLGKISGDGVFGLQRGFKKAGANSLIMSLWEVEDKATQLLMTRFYINIASGMSKHNALKEAQSYLRNYEQDSLKPFANPDYWAAFILLDGI